MKKILLLSAGLLAFYFSGSAQLNYSLPDTTDYPYWVEMMQDPDANFFQTQRAFKFYWQHRPITRGCGWKIFKRWEYMMQSRIAPDGTKPAPDAIFNAYEDYRKHVRSSGGNWINLGPSVIPAPGPAGYEGLGRLNAVAWHPTDPNKFYVGSPSGGMWQTNDGGLTWATHTDTLPTLGVSAILIDYSNPTRILIGTGDRDAGDAPGLGVFVSLNGGLTWAPLKTGMGDRTVGKMIQHPGNPSIILAATSGGVHRSIDGGANWTKINSGNFKDILFKPNDPNIVYAAAGASFYRSADNGQTFVQITSGLSGGQRSTIAITAANPNYVYILTSNNSSGFKGVYRSTDAGLNFSARSTSPNILDWSCDGSGSGGQGWYDLAIVADPNNPEIIYVGGVNVWKSTNGGQTWNINSHWYGGCGVPAVHADCHFLGYSPVNGKLYAGNDGGVYSTSNCGLTWTDHTVGMCIGQIYKLGQSQTVREKVINGFQDNGTYTYTPTGWVATGGGDGMECAVDYLDGSYTYHTIYYGDIYLKINNTGEKHIAGNGIFGITESGAWVTPFILGESNPKIMFVGYKNVWRCLDVKKTGYLTWLKISDNLSGSNSNEMAVLENSSANPDILYAVRYDNRLFRTDNCMNNNPVWIEMTSFLPVSGTPTDIEAHPSDPNIVYMTLGNNVYKSTDKGLSWTDISGGLPNIHISTIAYYRNAPEGLYVGTDAGVYYKDSTLTDWIPFSEGLPANGRITELEIYYDNDSVVRDVIRASTYGRGVWSSDLFRTTVSTDFTADRTFIPAGCGVNFTDLSTGIPTYFQWIFEGGTPASSTLKNPKDIEYNTPGTYTVSLKAWNEISADSITKTAFITVSDTLTPHADFTADKFAICTGESVHFSDLTDNCPVSWTWSFNPSTVTFVEGTNNHSQNPAIQFNEPGPYDVQLTAFNALGSHTVAKIDFILNGGYVLPFEESFTDGFEGKHWTILNPDGYITWDTISVPGIIPQGKSAWVNFYNYLAIGRRDQLVSPPMDLSSYSSAILWFSHAYAQRSTMRDSLIIKVSDDCGVNWIRVFAAGPNGTPDAFVTHPPMMDPFYPQSADDWCSGSYGVDCYQVDISPFAGKKDIKVMFESYCRYGNNLFVDNINISTGVGSGEVTQQSELISIYPNPSSGSLQLVLPETDQTVSISVLSPDGRLLLHQQEVIQPGSNRKTLDLSGFSKGIYLIIVTADDFTEIRKIILN